MLYEVITDLETLGGPASLGVEARTVFAPNGRLLREGETITQPRLAGAFTSLRMKGAGDAYAGGLGALIADANPEQAGARRAALRGYAAKVADPVT